uniref:Uncharacterized protein n=1 Tax=Rhipicephalus zambeziensis TaxID=60191 RepID=A0A224YHW7_9ACAR
MLAWLTTQCLTSETQYSDCMEIGAFSTTREYWVIAGLSHSVTMCHEGSRFYQMPCCIMLVFPADGVGTEPLTALCSENCHLPSTVHTVRITQGNVNTASANMTSS